MSCPSGIFRIESATFAASGKNDSCTNYLMQQCGTRSSCSFSFSDSNCGTTPESGVVKGGSASVVCANANTLNLDFGQTCPANSNCNYSGVDNEKDTVSMSCASGTLAFLASSYFSGADSESCLTYVSQACGGQTSCSLVFDNLNCGGDPDPGYVKSSTAYAVCNNSSSFTVTPSASNLTISPAIAQTVNRGASLSFSLTANPGYALSNQVGGSCPVGSWNGSTYTTGAIGENCNVAFSANISDSTSFTVTPSASNLTISPAIAQTVNSGASLSFSLSANPGYVLSNQVGGSCPVGSWNGSTYSTGAIGENCSVTFSANTSYALSQSGIDTEITGQLDQGQSISLGSMELVMQPDGNLVLYQGSTAVWASGSHSSCGTNQCYAAFQPDGNWVVYNSLSGAIWSSGTGSNPGAKLFYSPMTPYLEVLSSGGSVLWASSYTFSNLSITQNNFVQLGAYRFSMQSDGNFVLYNGPTPVWASNSGGQNCGSNQCQAVLQSDGNFVIYNGAKALWATNTANNPNAQLILSTSAPYVSIKTVGGIICSQITQYNGKSSDASAALQNCINETPSGGLLQIPAGNYTIAHQVLINYPISVTTQAGSQANCATQGSAACAEFTADPNVYAVSGFIKAISNSVTWDHIIINGNKANRYNSKAATQCRSGQNVYGQSIAFGGNNITVTNSVFENALCGTGFYLTGGSNYTVTNNTVMSNGVHDQQGLWSDGITGLELADSVITHNQIMNNTDVDMVLGACPNCIIQNNSFTHTGGFSSSSYAALQLHAWPNWPHGGTSGNFDGADISSNLIDCSTGHRCGFGIYVGSSAWRSANSDGGTVHNNTIRGAEQGFTVDLATNVTIYNNQVSGSGGSFWAGCGGSDKQISYTAYDITPGTNVNRSQDQVPIGNYAHFSVTGCVPNAYDHPF
jgi:hypothetical protein